MRQKAPPIIEVEVERELMLSAQPPMDMRNATTRPANPRFADVLEIALAARYSVLQTFRRIATMKHSQMKAV